MLSLSVRSSTDWNITPNTFVQDPPGLQSSSSKLSTISPYLHPRVILLTCTWPARASAHCARTHGHQCKCFQCHIPRITSLVPDLPMSVPFCEMMITRQADEIRNNSFYFPLKMNWNYLIPKNTEKKWFSKPKHDDLSSEASSVIDILTLKLYNKLIDILMIKDYICSQFTTFTMSECLMG